VERRTLVLAGGPDVNPPTDPVVGPWLAALADSRRRTFDAVRDVPAGAVDALAGEGPNAIGTLLYHVAAIEADWLFEDILGAESGAAWPAEIFPFDVREESGRLTPVLGVPMDAHLERLRAVRELLETHLGPMTAAEFEQPQARDAYDVSAAWVVHHLLQHEAEHRAQMSAAREAFERKAFERKAFDG
jgi:uncharacterized damage-inducible protein DinB